MEEGGLNAPNKEKEVKLLYYNEEFRLISSLETKTKSNRIE